jgi:hypothetical protein
MTIVSDSFHYIPVPVVKSNLDMLASFKVGDKPVTREGALLKEDRVWLVKERRAMEGAFTVKVIEDTYRSATQIIEKAEDAYSYAQPIQLMDDAETIKKKALRSLEGLRNMEGSYRKEAKIAKGNSSQKIETANNLRRIYQTYHSIFTPKSHSVSDRVSFFSQLDSSNAGSNKALKLKKKTSKVSSARYFWQKKVDGDQKPIGKSSSSRKEKKQSVQFKSSTETVVDEISHDQFAIVPIAQQEAPLPKKVSVPKRRVITILRRMAQETLDKVRLKKSKKSKKPYKEKSSIRTFIHEKGNASGSVTDELKAVFETKSSAISKRYEDFESHQEKMKQERKKEQRKEEFSCFDLGMLNRIEDDKDPTDDDISEGSNSEWNDDHDEQVMSMRREIIHNAQRRPLTRSISVYPGTVNNRAGLKDMVEFNPVTVDDNFLIVQLQRIRTYTQYSYSGDDKTEDDYFSDDEDPFVE